MKKTRLLVALALALASLQVPAAQEKEAAKPPPRRTAVRAARLIDVRAGKVI